MKKSSPTIRRAPVYFSLMCSDAQLRRPLRVCANSGFRVSRDADLGCITVHDGGTVILHAVRVADDWLVRLHRAYYRHPFGAPSDGDALPGVS